MLGHLVFLTEIAGGLQTSSLEYHDAPLSE
jgi:hypothetical protein